MRLARLSSSLIPAFAAASLVLGAAPPPAARPQATPAWSDLEAVLREAEWVVRATVDEAVLVEPIGVRVRATVTELLEGRKPGPGTVHYLTHTRSVVSQGDEELLLLQAPRRGEFHHRLVAKIGPRSPGHARKTAWLRKVLELRRLDRKKQGRAFVAFYVGQLRSPEAWNRRRALDELERLRGSRATELRAFLDGEELAGILVRYPDEADRKRLEALVDWRRG